MEFVTHGPDETTALGTRIGRALRAGDIVFLFGDLGAGKTVMAQGIAQGLGVGPEEYVRSPTFTLINQYAGRIPVYHIDLYRIEDPAELDNLGLEEYLFGDGVCIIEWAEKLFECRATNTLLFGIENRLEITLDLLENDTRRVHLRPIPPNRLSSANLSLH